MKRNARSGRLLQSLGRRDVLTLLGGAAVAWPLASRAQGADAQKRVGVLFTATENNPEGQRDLAALRQGLEERGWHDTKNMAMIVRWGAADPPHAAQLAAELISSAPDIVLAVAPTGVSAIRSLAGAIPIVFVQVTAPVGMGFVSSFAHPGGTITGFTSFESTISGKWLQLLKEIAPNVAQVGMLSDPRNLDNALFLSALKETAPSVGVTLTELTAQDDSEIDRAIAGFAVKPGRGLVVIPGPFSINHVERIISGVQHVSMPAMYWSQAFTAVGGLASYGVYVPDNFRRAADYIDRILKGAKPADLPVQAPTKYNFVINMKTAKALGLTVPPALLVRADEVIE